MFGGDLGAMSDGMVCGSVDDENARGYRQDLNTDNGFAVSRCLCWTRLVLSRPTRHVAGIGDRDPTVAGMIKRSSALMPCLYHSRVQNLAPTTVRTMEERTTPAAMLWPGVW